MNTGRENSRAGSPGRLRVCPTGGTACRRTKRDMTKDFISSPLFGRVERARRRKTKFKDTRITLAHGGGGKAMRELIAVGAAEIADAVVAGLRKYPNGRDACVIGEVKAEPRGMVVLETVFSGARIVDMLVGEQAPRIC